MTNPVNGFHAGPAFSEMARNGVAREASCRHDLAPVDMTMVDERPADRPAARLHANSGTVAARAAPSPPITPDGRYLVVRGRLWRRADPDLDDARRISLTGELMSARRAVGAALRGQDHAALVAARARVDAAKVALGERGPVWWTDGAPDQNRRMARNTDYARWYDALGDAP